MASWRPVSSNSTLKLLGAIDSLLIHCFLCCVFVHPSFCNYTHALLSCNTPLPKHQTTTPALSNVAPSPSLLLLRLQYYESFAASNVSAVLRIFCIIQQRLPYPLWLLLPPCFYCVCSITNIVSAVLRIFCCFYCVCSTTNLLLLLLCLQYYESFADGPYLYIVMELVEVRNALHSHGAYNGLHSHTQSWSVHSQCST